MDTLNLLLVVLAGIQICDIAIALVLYFIYNRQEEYLYVISMWVGMLAFFLMDNYLGPIAIGHIFFSYSFAGLSSISIAKIITRLFNVPFRWKRFLVVLLGCYCVSLLLALNGVENFRLLGGIVGIGIIYPVIDTTWRAYGNGKKKYTLDNLFLGILFIWGAHFLDYPFLRPIEDISFSIFGFSFALILTYLTSVLVPVIINRHRHIQLTKSLRNELSTHKDNLQIARDQIIARENLANLGALTAGIAHEIKNPINIILNSANVLGKEIEKGHSPKVLELSNIIERNTIRADEIIKSILAQSSKTDPVLEDVELNEIVESSLNLVKQSHIEQKVSISCDYGDIPVIKAYKKELVRSFINLFENAFLALKDKKPINNAEISVKTYQEGEYSVIRIRDNGVGIKASIKDEIFKPFYTTRLAGEGTGLGLSMVRDIIRYHKGQLDLDSVEGEYTEFNIKIPRNLAGV